VSDVEVLIASYRKDPVEIIRKIHVQSDFVFANQLGENQKEEIIAEIHEKVHIVSYDFVAYKEKISEARQTECFTDAHTCHGIIVETATRGVGKNRNITLQHATGKYLLFADDDNVLAEGYSALIQQAFETHPEADLIAFNADIRGSRVGTKDIKHYHRLHGYNSKRYGAFQIAIRKSTWDKNPVFFNEYFGGGCLYGMGEDVIFIKDCLTKGYHMAAVPVCIVTVNQERSTWFRGYKEKFFYDEGALVSVLFPRIYRLMFYYYAWKFGRRSKLLRRSIMRLMKEGAKGYKTLLTYDTYEKIREMRK
jgi:glycosyltransferase involved in cell wall biosynthesis